MTGGMEMKPGVPVAKTCICCAFANGYWPMYVGDDPRKWGTTLCCRGKRKRRVDADHVCKKWMCHRSFCRLAAENEKWWRMRKIVVDPSRMPNTIKFLNCLTPPQFAQNGDGDITQDCIRYALEGLIEQTKTTTKRKRK